MNIPAPPDADVLDRRIHALWDELADCDAADPDAALDRLMAFLCETVNAQNANWFGAVRLPGVAPDDPIHGWRPRFSRYLHPEPSLYTAAREQTDKLENPGELDITVIRNVSFAGQLRANRLVDLAPPEWFESDYYRNYTLNLGYVDTIWAGCPVNADAEVYYGLLRRMGQPRFTPADCEAVLAVLRGLKWFHRQLLLSHGLLVAKAPLTAVERDVLKGLLSGRPEKEIAAALGQSPNTTHTHVTAIYRKFGVQNRGALMALWLGKAV